MTANAYGAVTVVQGPDERIWFWQAGNRQRRGYCIFRPGLWGWVRPIACSVHVVRDRPCSVGLFV